MTAPKLTTLASNAEVARSLRRRSLVNLSKMGHCAPSIMQTSLDVSDSDAAWLVRLTAGLPGGIGNMGLECGGVTAPLLLLGLHHGLDETVRGLPLLFRKAQWLLQRFSERNGSLLCKDIRADARLPVVCVGVVERSGQLLAETLREPAAATFAPEREQAYCRAYAHFAEARFHCAHAVWQRLEPALPADAPLLRATAAFSGGIAFAGLTCSALTAGVMALGLEAGDIEQSRAHVLHMLGLMAIGGDAFADEVNAFNKSMNRGQRLARWFEAELGSTQCRDITRCDFATTQGVADYVDCGRVDTCRELARKVAAQVASLLAEAAKPPSSIERPTK